MGDSATSARGPTLAIAETRDPLLQQSWSALEVLASALGTLEHLGGAPDLCTQRERLERALGRDQLIIELTGARRAEALQELVGVALLPMSMAAGATVSLRMGVELDYEARRADGGRELAPRDESPALTVAVDEVERAIIADTEKARALAVRLQDAARSAAYARVHRAQLGPRLLWARIRAFFGGLFGRMRRLLPLPRRRALPGGSGAHAAGEIERVLHALKARLTDLGGKRQRARRELAAHHEQRRNRLAARIQELAASCAGEIEVAAPGIPEGVTLRIGEASQADLTIRVDKSDADLGGRLQALSANRTAELARCVIATLCGCKNRILDLEKRARHVHEGRVAEALARKLAPGDARRYQKDAQRAMGRHAERIVQDAAAQLETLLGEARTAWEDRIASCQGMEQVRAEVASIESGGSYRLQLVCDELREKIAVQAARLVLELSRPLRQDLLRKRTEIAGGRSARVEETFEDLRLNLPASMDATFGALATPELGELLSTERSILDPVLRTLAREKRRCTTRLRARLDDIEKQTIRDLFAAAVYLSPLLLSVFDRIVEEQLSCHERWIAARVEELGRAYQEERAQQAPALAMVEALERQEQTLARLIEGVNAGSSAAQDP